MSCRGQDFLRGSASCCGEVQDVVDGRWPLGKPQGPSPAPLQRGRPARRGRDGRRALVVQDAAAQVQGQGEAEATISAAIPDFKLKREVMEWRTDTMKYAPLRQPGARARGLLRPLCLAFAFEHSVAFAHALDRRNFLFPGERRRMRAPCRLHGDDRKYIAPGWIRRGALGRLRRSGAHGSASVR